VDDARGGEIRDCPSGVSRRRARAFSRTFRGQSNFYAGIISPSAARGRLSAPGNLSELSPLLLVHAVVYISGSRQNESHRGSDIAPFSRPRPRGKYRKSASREISGSRWKSRRFARRAPLSLSLRSCRGIVHECEMKHRSAMRRSESYNE